MKNESMCIMLIDDNIHDNFFHEREIRKTNLEVNVIAMESGPAALDYLRSMEKENNTAPVLIFLDINMPGMSGWEFLDEYSRLDKEIQSMVMIVMLTTSDSPESKARAKSQSFVSDYITKPLTKEIMEEVYSKYFQQLQLKVTS